MSKIVLVIGSVTTATHLSKALESLGSFEAEVIHTPAEISGGSCSYSVKINYDSLYNGLQAANAQNIKIKNIYREIINQEGRVYDDIS